MQLYHFKSRLQNVAGGADPSINIRGLIIPREETNTSEGCEYLDDNIRMNEQPYYDTKAAEEREVWMD